MIGFSTIWRFQSSIEYFRPFWENNITDFELLSKHILPQSCLSNTPLKVCNILVSPPEHAGDKVASLASEIESQRQIAIQNLLQACQNAYHTQAKYVVVWPGTVSFLECPSNINTIIPTPQQWEMRRAIAAPYLERVCRGLYQAIREYPGLTLCLLSPQYWYELPLLEEVEMIQSELSKYSIQYWHNPARIHFLEKAGLPGQDAWVSQYGKCMAGIHLEDCLDDQVLVPPGLGHVQWERIKKNLPRKISKIVRIHSNFEPQHVSFCYQYLQENHWFNF